MELIQIMKSRSGIRKYTSDKILAMKKPEMIIFDYGHTLLYEPNHNTSNGNRAIYDYISKNPHDISFEEFDKTVTEIFGKIKKARGDALEIHEHAFLKLAYEYMDIELSVTLDEAEKIIWNGISKGAIMPYADKMLNYLDSVGIRTGVISNLCFSGNALKERLDRLLSDNKFQFVLASSDYVFKKPDSTMFEIALQREGLTADKVWYCGDSIVADVYGAHGVGIFPVFYEGKINDEINPLAKWNEGLEIDFDYLHIHDWRELIAILENIK